MQVIADDSELKFPCDVNIIYIIPIIIAIFTPKMLSFESLDKVIMFTSYEHTLNDLDV